VPNWSVAPSRRSGHAEQREAFQAAPHLRPMGAGRSLHALRKDGTEFPVEIGLSPVETEDGVVVMAIIRDVTVYHAAESRFAGLLEAAPDAMVIVDASGRIVLANSQVAELFGYRRYEVIGEKIELLLPKRFRDRHPLHRQRYLETKQFRPMGAGLELFARRKDGTEFPVEISLSPLETSEGTLVTAAIRDITDRKKAEARFAGLLEAAPDAMVIVDVEGRVILVNSQTEKLFGYRREQILGNPVEMLIPQRFRPGHPAHRAGYLEARRFRPMGAGLELFAQHADGSEFPVEISLSPVETEEGPLITAAIRDVTERKRSEAELATQRAELARSNAELEQFAYVASHDLQEPLRMVSSYTQLLAREYGGKLDENAERYIDFAVDGVKRMQQLINDLLAYSRVGTRGREFEVVNLETVLERVLSNLQVVIDESGVKLSADDLPKIVGDPLQIMQVVQNLIANAIKFRGEAPLEVYVGAERGDSEWVFYVKDNGIGIAPKYADRIFLIFQRLHSRRKYEGTGIGLAICKRIVERHGGRIWFKSEVGQGATFFFSIPDAKGTDVE
jgi:PAS domain S-box-containing protein